MTTPDVQTLFKRHFGSAPTHVVHAPGYVELLGGQALCSDGLVISAAINRHVYIASTPRQDGKVELVSSTAPERELFWLSQLQANSGASWADGVKRVLGQFQRRGANTTGFSAAIWDDLPSSGNFGRHSAVEVAAALTLRMLSPFSLTESGLGPPPKRNAKGEVPPLVPRERLHLAKLLHGSEERVTAESTGWLGPASSLLGRAWHALNVDLRFCTVEPAPMIGEIIVVCEPESATPEFAGTAPAAVDDLRRNCALATIKLGAKSLRSVEASQLKAARPKLTPREYECASHVIGELARVVGGERALQSGDHGQFGQFLFQSHESSRTLLKNMSPETNTLVEIARAHPGCVGARGQAAATINLVSHHQAESFMKHMAGQYEARTGRKLRTLALQVVDGAT